jgi:hypothetical protein
MGQQGGIIRWWYPLNTRALTGKGCVLCGSHRRNGASQSQRSRQQMHHHFSQAQFTTWPWNLSLLGYRILSDPEEQPTAHGLHQGGMQAL